MTSRQGVQVLSCHLFFPFLECTLDTTSETFYHLARIISLFYSTFSNVYMRYENQNLSQI